MKNKKCLSSQYDQPDTGRQEWITFYFLCLILTHCSICSKNVVYFLGDVLLHRLKKMEFTMYLHFSTITTSYEVFIIFPYFVLTPDKIQEHIRQSYIAICRAYCAGVSYHRSFKLPTLSFCSNFKQFMNLFQLDILLTLDLNKILSIFMTKGNLPI